MAGQAVLQIGYDAVLIEIREDTLRRDNYSVASLLGNDVAMASVRAAQPDLVVIGSGGSYDERLAMARWLQENLPQTPVLVMCVSRDEEFPDGVTQFYGDTPRDWLTAVGGILRRRSDLKAPVA